MTLLNYIGLGVLVILALFLVLGLFFSVYLHDGFLVAALVILLGLSFVGLLYTGLYLLFL